jgi:hypothetical protein
MRSLRCWSRVYHRQQPGLVVGAYAANRLGAIRDAKGKSVAAVSSELGAPQKVEARGIRVSEPVLCFLI